MSKNVEKYSAKEVSIPAHAKEIETNNYFIERSVNTGVFFLFNLPTFLPLINSDVSFSLVTSILGFVGFLGASLTIPTMGGTDVTPNTPREAMAVRFAKVPLLHLCANNTFTYKDSGEDQIIATKHGKTVIYDVTQPNPKDLWDKMYESETGNSVHEDFVLLYK